MPEKVFSEKCLPADIVQKIILNYAVLKIRGSNGYSEIAAGVTTSRAMSRG